LRGADLSSRSDVTNVKKARAFFKKAIELDPEYVPAYVGHARASVDLFSWGIGPAGDLLDEAERSLREAELLDPDSSAVRGTRGMVGAYRNDWVGAERAFKKALELDPIDYWAQQAWALLLYVFLGRPQEAAELYELARWREPLHLLIASHYAFALAQAGRVDEAERELQRIIEIDPNYSTGHLYRGELKGFFQNQIALGISSYARAFELDPQSVYVPLETVWLFLSLGDDASAERWAELGERNSAGGYLGKDMRFLIAWYRGDEKSAESISRGMAETVQTFAHGNRYIGDFAWLRLLQRADPNLAMQVYARLYPGLLQDEPQVNPWNHAAAISLADLLRRSGNDTTADSLLEKSLSVIGETTDRYYPPARATAYLLQGETDRALAALREDIDAGWRAGWWLLEREPIYEPLWDQPEFQAMMAEVKADMAAQLARVREMERNGELEPIPEVSATTQ
jgi:tetratricopeptide (TPR) repeat protein